MLIPALIALPSIDGRLSIWFEFRWARPRVWDVIGYGHTGVHRPCPALGRRSADLAAARDQSPQLDAPARHRLGCRSGGSAACASGACCTRAPCSQERCTCLRTRSVQTLMISDFHHGLIPGLKDAIIPATVVVNGLQGAVGMTLLTMYLMRRLGNYEKYFSVEQFWALSKPLLAFSLLWFYFGGRASSPSWYGRQPGESEVIRLLVLDEYRGALMISFFLNFIGPLIALVWNPVRRSVWGPALVGTGVVIGALVNQVRSTSRRSRSPDPSQHVLHPRPATQWPEAPDLLIMVGAISRMRTALHACQQDHPGGLHLGRSARDSELVKVRRYLNRYARVIAKSH